MVIAITGLLGLLIIPALIRTGVGSAEQAVCVANLRKLMASTLAYAGDHNWKILYYFYDPNRTSNKELWYRPEMEQKGYLTTPDEVTCPSLLPPVPMYTAAYGMRTYNPPAERPEGYINSNRISQGGSVETYILANQIENPSRYPLYADSVQTKGYSAIPARAGQQWHRFSVSPASSGGAGIHLRHVSNTANVAFLDGHVESLDSTRLHAYGITSGYDRSIELIRFSE